MNERSETPLRMELSDSLGFGGAAPFAGTATTRICMRGQTPKLILSVRPSVDSGSSRNCGEAGCQESSSTNTDSPRNVETLREGLSDLRHRVRTRPPPRRHPWGPGCLVECSGARPWKVTQGHQGPDKRTRSKVLQGPHERRLSRLVGSDQDRLTRFDREPTRVLDAPVVLNSRPREPHHISRHSVSQFDEAIRSGSQGFQAARTSPTVTPAQGVSPSTVRSPAARGHVRCCPDVVTTRFDPFPENVAGPLGVMPRCASTGCGLEALADGHSVVG